MACCAFAVFLLGQIALAINSVWTRVFGAPPADRARANPVAAWRPGLALAAAGPAAPAWLARTRKAVPPRVIAFAVCLELVVAGGGVALSASMDLRDRQPLSAALSHICHFGRLTALGAKSTGGAS